MTNYRDVCVLCGISRDGHEADLAHEITPWTTVAETIASYDDVQLSEEQLIPIMRHALHCRDYDWLLDRNIPQEVLRDWTDRYIRNNWNGSWTEDAYVVGHFGPDGGYRKCSHFDRELHPTGDAAQLRHVRWNSSNWRHSSYSWFLIEDGENGELRVLRDRPTQCSLSSNNYPPVFNKWVHRSCFHYLHSWLDCPLPPKLGRLGQPLSLMSELYEIVNSRTEPLSRHGRLPCIDYYYNVQQEEIPCIDEEYRRNMKDFVYTRSALKHGRRGLDLLVALVEDCQQWVLMEPYTLVL